MGEIFHAAWFLHAEINSFTKLEGFMEHTYLFRNVYVLCVTGDRVCVCWSNRHQSAVIKVKWRTLLQKLSLRITKQWSTIFI